NINGNDTIEIFSDNAMDMTNPNMVDLIVPNSQLHNLSVNIQELENLELIMSYELDEAPASFQFVLFIDVTVAVEFDF
ncbi:MAG: hypothetical protein RJQ14_23780, partial [Marinoscillum sp.]